MLSPSILRTGFRQFLRHPLQSGLMIFGVALGVAVVIAIDIANSSASKAFDLSTERVVGRATHQIVGGPAGVPQDLFLQLWEWEEGPPIAPVVDGVAFATEHDNRVLHILGIDPFSEGPFRDYLRASAFQQSGFEGWYIQPGSALLPAELASQFDIRPGASLRIQVNDQFFDIPIIGLLAPDRSRSRLIVDNLILMDIASAQEILGYLGRLTRIDLILEPGQVEHIKSRLPAGMYLRPASDQNQAAEELTAAFRLNLTALSLLALVVGMFLVYNTITFNILQRRRTLGILRTLGALPKEIMLSVLLEVFFLAAVGSLVGVFLGWLLGHGSVRLVSQTISDHFFSLSVQQVSLTIPTLMKGVLLGIGSGILAAILPAWEAARVTPVTSVQRSTVEQTIRDRLPLLSLLGLAFIAVGTIGLVTIRNSLTLNFLGMFIVLLGIALLVAPATLFLIKVFLPAAGFLVGSMGRLALRTIDRSLSRTGVAIAALTIALSVSIGVSLMIRSFRGTLTNWLDLTLRADLYISAPTTGAGRPTSDLPPALLTTIGSTPGVDWVEPIRSVEVRSEYGSVELIAVDARRERDTDLYRFAAGDPGSIWEKVSAGAVIVSEPFYHHHHLDATGERVDLYTSSGWQAFEVVGVYYDYASDRGSIMMSLKEYQRWWEDPFLSSMGVHVAEGAEADIVASELRRRLDDRGLSVQDNQDLRGQALRIFDQTFTITLALRLLTLLVAFIGVISAVVSFQMERERELATLQALGLTDRGLQGLTFMETGSVGLISGLLALPVGFLLAMALIYIINLRSFGWTINLSLEPLPFLQAVGAGVVAALLAAIPPALRIANTPIARSLRSE